MIMPYSDYKKQRIVDLYTKGLRAPSIQVKLAREGLTTTRQGIYKFLRKFEEAGTIARRPGSGRPSKVAGKIEQIIEAEMQKDDDTTVEQLQKLLQSQGHTLSKMTILCCGQQLGWNTRGAAYCQMIRKANKAKRLNWAKENIDRNFNNVIWTDKTSVQMERHRRFCCR